MGRTTLTLAAVLAAGLSLAACDMLKPDKDADAAARKVVDEVAAGTDLSKDATVDPGMTSAESTAELGGIHALFPDGGKPTATKNTGWSINAKVGEPTRAELSYSYVYPDRTLDLRVVLKKTGDKAPWQVAGLQARRKGGTDAPMVAGEQPAPPKKDGE